MLTSIAFVVAALILAAVAAHEGYRLGEHRGYMAGKRDGWNAHVSKLAETRAAQLKRMQPKPGTGVGVLLENGDSYIRPPRRRPQS